MHFIEQAIVSYAIQNLFFARGVIKFKVFREYDMKFWNFANKGFFNFFQKAKTKLAN